MLFPSSRALCYSFLSRYVTANTVVLISPASAAFLEDRLALRGSVELEVDEFLKKDLPECFATFDYGNGNSFESTYVWIS